MKKSITFLASLFLLLGVSSCTNQGGSASNNGGGGGSGTTEPGGSYDDVGEAAPKEIQFWHCIGHGKMTNLQIIIDKFNKDHAATDGYYVKAYQIAGDYDALHDNVKTRLNAGFVPAITMGYPDSFSEYIGSNGANNSKILRLDDFIENDADFDPSTMVQQYYAEGSEYQYPGTWSVPLYKSTEVMYYNIEAFQATQFYKDHYNEEYGKYGAILGQPATWDWDTLIYVAKEIQKEKYLTADFHALGYDSDANLLISQMAQRGIPFTTAEGTGAAHFLFMEPDGQTLKPNAQLKELVEDLYTMTSSPNKQEQCMVTQSTYGTYASEIFLQEKVMFTIGSTGGSVYNEPKGKFHAGMVPVPAYQNNRKYIMQGPSLCFFDINDDAKSQAAWEFYSKYVSDPELNAGLALENSYDPVRTTSYETEGYQAWTSMGVIDPSDARYPGASYSDRDNLDVELAYRIPNLTKQLQEYYITTPIFVGSGTARDEIGKVLSYVREEGDVDAALRRVYRNCVLSV